MNLAGVVGLNRTGKGHPRLTQISCAAGGTAQRLLAFAGPGYLVAVASLDPGNWATSIAGGAQFGYALLSVLLISNLMAMALQAAAVRLGLAGGQDLAQACRHHLPPAVTLLLWALCEVAIIACNLAEVLGMAIGLNLLLGLPLPLGVCATVVVALLILVLQRRGFRSLQAVVVALVTLVGTCFAAQLVWLQPPLAAVLHGFIPRAGTVAQPHMLYLAVGIVGATVMPHNLYLHSAIVQTRQHAQTPEGMRKAIRFATTGSTVALALALLVNAGIMVVAASAFSRTGVGPVTKLSEGYALLSPMLGAGIASAVFGLALLTSGLSSSVTGTLAGYIVMEDFLDIRLSPVLRALLTRCIAVVPALLAIAWFGSAGAGALLIFSQVVLGLQLPFAVFPLLWFTTRRKHLGEMAFGWPMSVLLWTVALAIVALNAWMLQQIWAAR